MGVIGIEIDYSTMAEQVESIRLYENGYAFINVSENDYSSEYYDTELEKAAETQENVLEISQDDRLVNWTNTDAGGTVFYNNIRQTADVTVKKELAGNTTIGAFPYSAFYMS